MPYLWLTGWFAIKVQLWKHAWAWWKDATQSVNQPASPVGRGLKRTSTALYFWSSIWPFAAKHAL